MATGPADLQINLAVVVPGVLGVVVSAIQWGRVNAVKLEGHKKNDMEKSLKGGDDADDPDALANMKEIGKLISDGAMSFLAAEYKILAVFTVLFSVLVTFAASKETAIAFLVGAFTSTVCGYLGMLIAVSANLKTAHECWGCCEKGYAVAITGGSVMGLSLVSIGLLVLFGLILVFKSMTALDGAELYEAIAGYGLGGSAIALFGRVGGGIYTKAADVGADLSGKIDEGMDEDDKRNPACIADNVGDNVGDIAGMGSDLFGSFAESTCAALVIGSAPGSSIAGNWAATMFPLLISSTGIVVGILTLAICGVIYKVDQTDKVEGALKGILIVSTILETPCVYLIAMWTLPADGFHIGGYQAKALDACWPIWMGLWSGLLIGFVTEYYTSFSYQPVRQIADQQKTSAATGIIFGLAVGYMSCIVPVFCIAVTVLVAHQKLGMYGVALGALGMLSTITMGLTIDAYGPISDNAGGIAEMSGLSHNVRKITDALDAAGNTTAAIGKGFAIGSAALVSLALFGAYTVRAQVETVDALDAWTFTGLLIGAMIPYAFAAMTMRSVAFAATAMVEECREQFKGILHGNPPMAPDYERCIRISTNASLYEMIQPGLLVMLSPIAAGFVLGKNGCAGLLIGGMISAVQMAISMSNTGGAWDNAKKYAEKCGLKGQEQYKNAVIGDTVGDPMKDTSGPALNIVMKLSAIISLVFGATIASWSTDAGGPKWVEQMFPPQ